MDTDLLGFVKARVDAYDGSLTDLSRDTGVGLSWLAMFKRGKIPNPGVQQIQKLAEHFRGQKRPRGNGHISEAA